MNKENKSSSSDVAKISCMALKNEVFCEVKK